MDFQKEYKNKKVLVIGGTGFIGSNLVAHLGKLGCRLWAFTRSKRGFFDGCYYCQGDIAESQEVGKIIKNKFDLIFHCAGFSGQTSSERKPFISFRNNVLGTINLLKSVKKYSNQTKIIFTNSRLEYGRAQYLPVDENHSTKPMSFYGIDKLLSTLYALQYFKIFKIPVVIFRISNVYGPHQNFHFSSYNVINYFIDLASRGQNLIIFGKGEQVRDYLYIDDLIEVLLLAGIKRKAEGQVYNVGWGRSIKFKQMIKIIASKTNVKIKYISWPSNYRKIETGSYISDIRKIKNHLGWYPKIKPEQGIELCLKLKEK